jgi:predicted Zn-dependent protease
MACRIGLRGAPLFLVVAGCFLDEPGNLLVPPNAYDNGTAPRLSTAMIKAPATEEAAKRALSVGQKVLAANSQLGLRPLILTIGGPEPEIFHVGAGQLFITDGLVRQCTTDGQLAAVLCHELARMAAEGEELVQAGLQTTDHGGPDEGRTGHDYRSGFGNADGLRLADLARDEQEKRRRAALAQDPATLARQYLGKAGYADADFTAAAPLLRAAEANEKFRQFMTTSTVKP